MSTTLKTNEDGFPLCIGCDSKNVKWGVLERRKERPEYDRSYHHCKDCKIVFGVFDAGDSWEWRRVE